MPIRIIPVYDMGLCTLYFKEIGQICGLIASSFENVKFSASDDMWEVYDENKGNFLKFIKPRNKLDSFYFVAQTLLDNQLPPAGSKTMTIKGFFDENKADLVFDTLPENEEWLKVFIKNFKQHVDKPSLQQRLASSDRVLVVPFLGVPFSFTIPKTPKCRIISEKLQINPRVENIALNLIASAIFAIFCFIAGVILASIFGGVSGVYHYIQNVLSIPTPIP